MQKIFLICAVFCAVFGFSASIAAQDKTVDKTHVKQLEAIYRELDAATKKRELKTYEKYLDKTFTIEKNGTKITRAQILELMKQFLATFAEITESTSKIEKIKVADGSYFLETSSVLRGRGKALGDKISNIEIFTKSTDVWIKTDKGWREILQIEGESKVLVDGDPVIFN